MTERHTLLSKETLLAKSSEILYGSESIGNLLEQLQTKLFDNHFAQIMFENIENQSHETSNSAQVILHRFYISLVTLHVKGLAMQMVAYQLKNKLENFESSSEEILVLETFYKQLTQINNEFVDLVNRADRCIWKSDPRDHILYKTYDKITRFNQLYFVQKQSFDGHCKYDCEYYKNVHHFNPIASSYPHIPKQRNCNGVLKSCRTEAKPSWLCYGLNIWLPQSTSDRFYEYVEGNMNKCQKYGKISKSRPSDILQWSNRVGFSNCDICRCVCDDPDDPKTDRYFSLAEIRTNTEQNMVVTGVRFIKQDQIFHLQIQEARLKASGNIDTQSRKWKSLPKLNKHDSMNVYTLSDINSQISIGVVPKPDSNYVVTGVKFSRDRDTLNLNVIYTQFEPTTGQLLTHTDITKSMQRSSYPFYVNNRDIPINYHNNAPDSSLNTGSVYFNRTGIVYDLEQSTIPFIDILEVESSLMPLSSIGLHLRINGESGGFIAPKLETFPVRIPNMLELDVSTLYMSLSSQDAVAKQNTLQLKVTPSGASQLCMAIILLPLNMFAKILL